MLINSKLLILNILIVAAFTVSADTIYEHKDDQGTTSFTDSPGSDAKEVSISKPNVATTSVKINTEVSGSSAENTYTSENRTTEKSNSADSSKNTQRDSSRPSSLSSKKQERAKKQAELDEKCEAARQRAMIPKKEEIYQECIHKNKKEASACREDADSYNGSLGVHKPLHYDLPECVTAFKHKRRKP